MYGEASGFPPRLCNNLLSGSGLYRMGPGSSFSGAQPSRGVQS